MTQKDKGRFGLYTRSFIVAVAVMLCTVAGFNLVVDPLGLFNMPRFEYFNAYKPGYFDNLRTVKSYDVNNIRPQGLVLGTSRALHSIDPAHPGWRVSPVYNLALTNGTMLEVKHYFKHALAANRIKQAVLVLDMGMFKHGIDVRYDYKFSRLRHPGYGQSLSRWPNIRQKTKDYFGNLVSYNTLRTSLYTVFINFTGLDNFRPLAHDRNGRGRGFSFYRRIAEQGQLAVFNHNDWLYMTVLHFSGKRMVLCKTVDGQQNYSYIHLKELLQMAYRSGVEMYLATSPSHARHWNVVSTSGLEAVWHGWLKEMVRINEEQAAKANKTPYPFYDFTGFNSVTEWPLPNEPLTLQQSREYAQKLPYFDSSHYKKVVGDLMLDRIFNTRHSKLDLPQNFGSLVSGANIDKRIALHRSNLERWRNANKKQAMKTFRLAFKTRSERPDLTSCPHLSE